MSETVLQENKMGTAKMFPLIMKMGLPAMFSMMVQALYNIVDSYYVSSYSTDALSGVSLALPIQMLIIAFSVGTAIGTSSLVSRKLGEKQKDVASLVATHGLVLNVLTYFIFLVFSIVGTEAFIRIFETDEVIVQNGIEYLSIVSGFSIFCFIQISLEKTLQATGNMILPMIMQLVGAVLNILLDPVFIFGFGPIPAMGSTGAAIATIIGQFAAALLAIFFILSPKFSHEIHFGFKGFRFKKDIVKLIYIVGFPSIVMNAVGTIMLSGMNLILTGFSSAAYTVFNLYFRLQSFVFMPVFGLTSGLMPILGYNYGAKNKKRLLSCLKIGGLIAFVINTVGMLVFLFFPTGLLGMFQPTQEILDIGIPALQTISMVFPLAAVSITASTLFQAVGKGFYSLLNSVLRQLVLILPLAYFLSFVSLDALWFAYPLSELGALAITLIYFVKLYKQKIRHLGDSV